MDFWWEVTCKLGFEECLGALKNRKERKSTSKRNRIFRKGLKYSWRKIVWYDDQGSMGNSRR